MYYRNVLLSSDFARKKCARCNWTLQSDFCLKCRPHFNGCKRPTPAKRSIVIDPFGICMVPSSQSLTQSFRRSQPTLCKYDIMDNKDNHCTQLNLFEVSSKKKKTLQHLGILIATQVVYLKVKKIIFHS